MPSMDSLYLHGDEGIRAAADILKRGGIVAFPTETVYGLGANALDEAAVLAVFEAKGRPLTDPLIVHVEDKARALGLVEVAGEEATVFDALAQAFWPGPLTIIAKAAPCIPPKVTAGTGFVGVRCPNHPLAISLLRECGLPVAAPSANRFGHVSPTRAEHVVADLGCKGVRVLSGEGAGGPDETGGCEHGIESTVCKVDGQGRRLVIFRQGAAAPGRVERVIAEAGVKGWDVVVMSRAVAMQGSGADGGGGHAGAAEQGAGGEEAPGQAITHYAPDVPCLVVTALHVGDVEAMAHAGALSLSAAELASTVVVDFGGQLAALRKGALAYRDLSRGGRARDAAHDLFSALRWAEAQQGAARVLLPMVGDSPVGAGGKDDDDISLGVADRIFRAASGVSREVHVAKN